ncbi:MAG: HAMP domain-containing protein [Acidimicrobiales bacterium]|nr:HAMP domain-containing protein [Acidimicrobiales bacterium]
MTRRLVLSYLAVTLVLLAVLEIPLGITYGRRQLDDLTTQVERDAVALATFAEDALDDVAADGSSPGTAGLTAIAGRYAEQTGGRVVIVDDQGLALVDTDPPAPGERTFATRPEFEAALRGEVATGSRHSATLDTDLVYVAVPVASGGVVHGAVRLTYPSSAVDARVRRYWLGLGLVAAVSLGAVALVGVALARGVTRPLRRVQEAATRLGAGDLAARAPADEGPEEVRALARAFNDTAARLEELVRSQDAFVADASHQLRTPLTALRLRLEYLDADVAEPAREDLDAALAELARLSRLVDGLLALARADRTASGTGTGPLDVGAAVEERRAVWAPLAAERGVELSVTRPAAGGPWALATADHLAQVLDNLLANALEVSPAGATLALRASTSTSGSGAVELHVVDEGPGLGPEERERAFDRFWRSDPGRHRDDLGGSGLGLSIVARLVAADGGTVGLEPAPTGGIDAVVRLRSAPRPPQAPTPGATPASRSLAGG